MSRWPPRPSLSPVFYKAHGLGNDYLVFEAGEGWMATPHNVERVCDRFRGVGSDGIVAITAHGEDTEGEARVELRMFNPDGGEFERSGNGLRVLGSFFARRDPGLRALHVRVGGDEVLMSLHGREGPVHDVSVAMGRASLGPGAVELDRAALSEDGETEKAPGGAANPVRRLAGPGGETLSVVPVSVGNPHLVVLVDGVPTESELARLGPFLTAHPALRHGANVQLAAPAGEGRCEALIWERGVGRTSASGTSACAVAVAMVSAGRLAAGPVRVEMPGGTLSVDVKADYRITLRGPVEEVMEGRIAPALLATFEPAP